MDDQAEVMMKCCYGGCNGVSNLFWVSLAGHVLKSDYCIKHGMHNIERFNTREEAQLWLIKQRL